ncbi:unnamed protein product, partial [Mycena citricolor]
RLPLHFEQRFPATAYVTQNPLYCPFRFLIGISHIQVPNWHQPHSADFRDVQGTSNRRSGRVSEEGMRETPGQGPFASD